MRHDIFRLAVAGTWLTWLPYLAADAPSAHRMLAGLRERRHQLFAWQPQIDHGDLCELASRQVDPVILGSHAQGRPWQRADGTADVRVCTIKNPILYCIVAVQNREIIFTNSRRRDLMYSFVAQLAERPAVNR